MTVTTGQQSATLSDQVAEEIRAMLGRQRMSQAELARQIKKNPMWVSDRLRGSQPIDLNDLQRIADALGVSVMELLPSTVRSGERSPVNVRSSRVGRPGYSDRVPPAAASPFTRQRRDRTHPGSPVPLSQRRPHSLRPRNAYPIPA